MVSTTMRLERYYSSVREEVSPLSDSAKGILDNQDYVGFFKACGPNYVRGIRRAQEITSIFQYQSSSSETSRQFAHSSRYNIKKIGIDGGFTEKSGSSSASGKSKFKSINKSLVITIVGFGLGLNQEGAETLVATTMEEQGAVMRFAFNSMTKVDGAHNVGMVYGVEIVPWVNNVAFQVAAAIDDENVVITKPRRLIPRSFKIDGTTTWDRNDRNNYMCKSSEFEIDKYGYCCEIVYMVDPATGEYTGEFADPETHVCRPNMLLDPTLMKDNMANNGEFISRLDAAMRYRLTFLGTLEQCISAVNSIPDKYHYNLLKVQETMEENLEVDVDISLAELKMALDPKSDYGLLKHLTKEFDEWVDMFFSPCHAALYGTNIGSTPDVDVAYFMAYPWYTHDECMRLPCLSNLNRWDREYGGCSLSIMTGQKAGTYANSQDTYCSKEVDKYDREICKYDQTELSNYRSEMVDDCWSGLPVNNIGYLIDNFCMPDITSDELSSDEQGDIDTVMDNCGYPS